jgi:hypothetical protein
MDIYNFFAFNNNCPCCGAELSEEALIDILVSDESSPTNVLHLEVIGTMLYLFSGKNFVKIDNISYLKSASKELEVIFKNFPETFSMNKRFLPRINKDKISKLIYPMWIGAVEVRFIRTCFGPSKGRTVKHMYYYQSQYLLENDKADIEINHEILDIYNNRIYNNFAEQPITTTFGNPQTSPQMASTPYIPISKWRINNRKAFKTQIENYMLLK